MRSMITLLVLLLLVPVATGATDFVPGDKILLTPRSAGPVVLRFEGVPGMEMKFKLKQTGDSEVIAAMTLVSPTGDRRALGTASSKGKLKVKPILDESGTWSLEVTSADGSFGDVKLKTKANIPDKFKEKIDIPADGSIAFPFFAIAGSEVSVKLKGDAGPQLDSFEDPDGGGVVLASPLVTSKKYRGSLASAPTTGRYELAVAAEEGPGRIKVTVKVRAPEGDEEIDIRVTVDATNLLGVYQGGVLDTTEAALAAFGLLTGGIDFDGAGGFTHAMEHLSVVEDAAAPGGYRLEREIPGNAVPGLYTLQDGVATLDFEPGSGKDESRAEMDVLLAGRLLLPQPEAGVGSGTGFLARRADNLVKGDLDGDYLYLFIEQSIEGDEPDAEVVLDVELGLLQLDGSGGILGGGLQMKLVLDSAEENGFRTESSEAALAFGTYSVGSNGEVTFGIRRQLFGGETEDHDLTALMDGVLLYAGGVDADDHIHASFMVELGTDERTSDAVGAYRHHGTRSSTSGGVQTTRTRSGTLTFDGAGAFAGTESVSQTVTEEGQDPVVTDLGEQAVSGTYEVQPFDLTSLLVALAGGGNLDLGALDLPLTIQFAGESTLQGVVTGGVDMMLAFTMDAELGFDLLVRE